MEGPVLLLRFCLGERRAEKKELKLGERHGFSAP